MKLVLLTALGVCGATVIGSIIGLLFEKIPHRCHDIILSFSAGVMLAAAVLGLVLPSLEYGGRFCLVYTVGGIFAGAFCLVFLRRLVPRMHRLVGADYGTNDARVSQALLFVMAITVHNLPEGIAAGVGFGSGNVSDALLIAGSIALQDIPDGMVIIGPLLSAGISRKRTFLCGVLSGLVEVTGTFIGYFAVTLATAILPFALAFAGGTMLCIVIGDLIPDTHAHGFGRSATYALLGGFCLMLIFDSILG